MPRPRLLVRLQRLPRKLASPDHDRDNPSLMPAGVPAEVPAPDSSLTAKDASVMPWRELFKAMLWVNNRYVLTVLGTLLVLVVCYLMGAGDLVDWLRAAAAAGVKRLD